MTDLKDMTNRQLIKWVNQLSTNHCAIELARRLEEQGTPDGYVMHWQSQKHPDGSFSRAYRRIEPPKPKWVLEAWVGNWMVSLDGEWEGTFPTKGKAEQYIVWRTEFPEGRS